MYLGTDLEEAERLQPSEDKQGYCLVPTHQVVPPAVNLKEQHQWIRKDTALAAMVAQEQTVLHTEMAVEEDTVVVVPVVSALLQSQQKAMPQ